ncbi:SphA family protein [Azospirillum sp.]|uniref:SphA family protein n=1 Tax=Azospirillum sp. TaxID=34012 RepID=UPI002D3D258D|nr:transporter [Azospirillum sp.]HYD68587.1 transporter [Azospirillum sp.]
MNWKKLLAAAAVAVGLAAAPQAQATEGDAQYPNGAEGFMAGAVPPPGTYFINYLMHYTAGRVNNDDGKQVPVNFRLNATAEVPRLLYVSNVQILGANWGAHILVPVVNLRYEVGPFSGHQFGLGDITIDPFILSWHWQNFHLATGLDIILPTGRYDRSRPVNIGANYWGIEPLVAGTYMSDAGFEVSAKLMYAFNTRNNDTSYRSGQAFHMDYMVAQHFGNWTAGLGGYWFQQTTDDDLRGVSIGNRGTAFAIGPAVKYDVAGISLIGKWQHEFVAHNRPQGDKLWVKLIMAF